MLRLAGFCFLVLSSVSLEAGPNEGEGVKAHETESLRTACVAAHRTEAPVGREVASWLGAQHLVPGCSLGLLPLKKKENLVGSRLWEVPGWHWLLAGWPSLPIVPQGLCILCRLSLLPSGLPPFQVGGELAASGFRRTSRCRTSSGQRVSPASKSQAHLCEPELGLRPFLGEILSPRGKEGGLSG